MSATAAEGQDEPEYPAPEFELTAGADDGLGTALGRELHVATLPEDAWPGVLIDAGFAPHIAQRLAEPYRADEHGLLAPRGDRSVHTSTTIEDTISGLLRFTELVGAPPEPGYRIALMVVLVLPLATCLSPR